MNNLFFNLKEKISAILFLDKLSWVLLILSIVSNLILWYIWFFQIHFNRNPIFFSFFVLVLNSFLSLLVFRKEPLAAYFLLSAALLMQILLLILIRFSFVFGY